MAKTCKKCGRNLSETAKLKIKVKQTKDTCKWCIAQKDSYHKYGEKGASW